MKNDETLTDNGIKVNLIFRKPQKNYYSVERVFGDLRNAFSSSFIFNDTYLPYYSRGIVDRVKNIFYCRKNLTDINHVTGDVNYIASFLPAENMVLTILDCVYRFNTKGLKRLFIWFFWYYLPVRRAKYITAISEFSKRETIAITGINPDRIKVVYVSLPEGFSPSPKLFNSHCPVILQVGASSNKNVKNLILSLRDIPCELWITGTLSAELIALLKASNVKYKNFIGLNSEEMINLYKQCDIVSFISLYEGFGMPVIEGQATGRVVITSNCASLPEVAGEAALIVDEPENPLAIRTGILRLINQPELRERLVSLGYENVKRFDRKKMARSYEEIYHSIRQ